MNAFYNHPIEKDGELKMNTNYCDGSILLYSKACIRNQSQIFLVEVRTLSVQALKHPVLLPKHVYTQRRPLLLLCQRIRLPVKKV